MGNAFKWIKVEQGFVPSVTFRALKSRVMSIRGLYYQAVDPKGRIIIPARIRNVLDCIYHNSRVMITAWSGILHVYPMAEYEVRETHAAGLDEFNPMLQRYRRTVVACAIEAEVDKQGRLQIPQEMRSKARLEKDIVIVGNLNVIEVWDRQRWEDYCAETESMAADINAALSLARSHPVPAAPAANGASGATPSSAG